MRRRIKRGKYECFMLSFYSDRSNSLGHNYSSRSFTTLSSLFKTSNEYMTLFSNYFEPVKVIKVINFSTGYCLAPYYKEPGDIIVWEKQ